jgi:hypothetical protein
MEVTGMGFSLFWGDAVRVQRGHGSSAVEKTIERMAGKFIA